MTSYIRQRCFGYTPDGDLIPAEADAIRTAAHMILERGCRDADVIRYLNDAGHTTTAGGQWSAPTLTRLLINPRLAGLATKTRTSATPAPAIITTGQHEQLVARAKARKASTYQRRESARPYRMLSGLLRCDVCGQRLTAYISAERGPSYRCPGGHVRIQTEPLEAMVSDWAIKALAAGMEPSPPAAVPVPDLTADRDQIRADRDAGNITAYQAQLQTMRLAYREKRARAQLEEPAAMPPLPVPGGAERWWNTASHADRRAVLCGLIGEITIGAADAHTIGVFEESRVAIHLRTDLARVS